VIVIPTHACSADDGRSPASDVYGELDRDNVATCALRVRWGFQRGQDERSPGCGARIAVCHGCGLRTRVNGAPCGTCGGEERPEVLRAQQGDRVQEAPRDDMAATLDRANRRADVSGQGDPGPRRETKEKAPSKPRAPRKSVKKGAAAPDGPGLPLFK
jgi:hypothetical protein